MRRAFPLAALTMIAACSVGQAATITHTYSVTDFSKLRVQGPFDVKVHTGVPTSVRAVGSAAMIERVAIEQNGDTLVIKPVRTSSWSDWGRDEKMVIEVGMRQLGAVSLAGSGDVAVDRVKNDTLDLGLAGSGDLSVAAVEVGKLKLAATGSGDLTAMGRADSATVNLTGSGDIHGDKLTVNDATVGLIGSGDITLGAKRTATINLAGSGDVTIGGPANCTITRAGSGDVRCARQSAGAE